MSATAAARRRTILSRFPPHWRLFSLAVLGLLLVSLWLRATTPARPEPVRAGIRPSSVAVLLFTNTNPDSADDYLGYGFAAELIRALGHIPGLTVAAQSSSLSESGGLDPLSLGNRLEVGTVLEGTIRRAGERLRVTAHLVDVEQGFDLWSEIYDRAASDLLQVEGDIVQALAATLRVPLVQGSAPRFEAPTSNPEAFDGYLMGLHLLHRSGAEDAEPAIAALVRAVRLDSSFALARSALAQAYLPPFRRSLPPRLTMPAAETAARRALELDSTLAEPHRTLGMIRFGYNRHWSSAETEFLRAIALDPRSPEGYQAYSRLLLAMGRIAESLRASQQAVALSPAAPSSIGHLGWHYLYARQDDLARKALERALTLDSTDWRLHLNLGLLEQVTGNLDRAGVHIERAGTLAPLRVEIWAANAQLRALSGEADLARAILQQLHDRSASEYVSPGYFAWVQAALGQRTDAFASLTRAVKERSELVPYFAIDPRLDSLRGDPRFARLLRQLRLR